MNRSSPGAKVEKGVLGSVTVLIGSSLSYVRLQPRGSGDSREGPDSRLRGAKARLTVKAWLAETSLLPLGLSLFPGSGWEERDQGQA